MCSKDVEKVNIDNILRIFCDADLRKSEIND